MLFYYRPWIFIILENKLLVLGNKVNISVLKYRYNTPVTHRRRTAHDLSDKK